MGSDSPSRKITLALVWRMNWWCLQGEAGPLQWSRGETKRFDVEQ